MKKIFFESLPSTSLYIKENFEDIDNNVYIVAKNQTNGYGRIGHSWLSSDRNLLFSFKVNPQNLNVKDYALLTLLTGVAMRNALEKVCNDNSFMIKWPNDILYHNRKVCGIICEGIIKNNVYSIVIGVGVNVNQSEFKDEIVDKATSLKNIYKQEFDIQKILESFDIEFNNLFYQLSLNNKSFIDDLNKYNYFKNKQVVINNKEYINKEFLCKSINNNGCLILQDDNGKILELNSNEVSLSNNYK